MAIDLNAKLLAEHAFFADLSDDQIRMIAFISERRALDATDILFRQYDEAEGGYLVISGVIAALKPGKVATETDEVEQLYYAGELIDPMSLIAPTKRYSAAICHENADLIYIPRSGFSRILNEYPELAVKMRKRVETDLAGVINKLDRVMHLLEDPEDT